MMRMSCNATFASAVLALGIVHCGSNNSSTSSDAGAANDGSPSAGGEGGLTGDDSGLTVVIGGDGGGPIGDDSGSHPAEAGGSSDSAVTPSGHIQTIFLVLMENHNWSDIFGQSAAPYINKTLLPMSSYCTAYYDNPKMAHPSEPNYIWLEAGDNLGILNDSDPSANHQSTTDHLVTALEKANVTWKSYQEDITAGTCPITGVAQYAPKHNPMVFFDDIVGNPPSASSAHCIAHVRPFTELAGDLSTNKAAQYNFITPNLCNDMHDSCSSAGAIAQGDTWLKTNLPMIMNSQAYKNGGAIFITWDESEGGENPIGMIVLSPKAKGGGFTSATKFYHSSMLRTVQDTFGITPLIRDAANQPNLGELFTSFP